MFVISEKTNLSKYLIQYYAHLPKNKFHFILLKLKNIIHFFIYIIGSICNYTPEKFNIYIFRLIQIY